MSDEQKAPKKYLKILTSTFVEDNKELNIGQCESLITECEMQIRSIREQMEADPKLATAKEIVTDLSSGYRNVKKLEEAKIQFFLDKIALLETNA